MRYRTLGKTGWRVSTVGMGCWGIGGALGPVPESRAVETIQAALDAGVNLFDTADAYGPRSSEEILGKTLQGVRTEVFIATKVGNAGWNDRSRFSYESTEHIYTCCDASLHRLRTDYIDLYLCHLPAPVEPAIFVEAFERLLEAGKIRAYGVSTDYPDVLERFDVHGRCAACQVGYSVLSQRSADTILPVCAMHDTGALIRIPLERGILTGRFGPDTTFDDMNRKVWWNEGEGRKDFLRKLSAAENLRPLASPGRSMTQVALAFTLAHHAVTCVIPGMTTPEQARENAAAAEVTLSEPELERLRAIDAA